MKKDSFLKGTLIASIAIIITKILGVIYVIPFYKIIGEEGGVLYSYAYNIYALFLNISTAGIPMAISMLISEYIAKEDYETKEKTYSLGKKVIFIFSILSFLILFIFSKYCAMFFVKGIEGTSDINNISLVIKAISISLIIIPFLSILRGYLQGQKFISASSISQVYEQVIRIFIVLVGSFISINILKTSVPIGVAVALTGSFIGGLGAYFYLKVKIKKNDKLFIKKNKVKKAIKSNKEIVKKIILYSIPLITISITTDLYNLIDIKLIIKGLYMIGIKAQDAELISSIIATWAPKICVIVMAIAMGLTTNLIPHIVEKYTKNNYKESNKIFNQAISTMIIVALPLVLGIIILSNDIYYLFYGFSKYGPNILIMSAIVSLVWGILSIVNTILQGFKKFKLVIINTIIGLFINAILDIPLILLLDKLGFTPYYGTQIATIIGTTISIIIAIKYLKKKYDFHYSKILMNVSKTFIPLLIMSVVAFLLNKIITPTNILILLIKLLLISAIGAIIYLTLLFKNKGLYDTFGQEQIDRILVKLHLKK